MKSFGFAIFSVVTHSVFPKRLRFRLHLLRLHDIFAHCLLSAIQCGSTSTWKWSRGSQECLNFSRDLDRCLARNLVLMTLNKSARDIVLVYECHRVLHFRSLRRPCFVCSGVVTSHAQWRVWQDMYASSQQTPFWWLQQRQMFPIFCLPVLPQWNPIEFCGNVCEDLKSGLHSLNDRMCFVNLMIHQKLLKFLTLFTQTTCGVLFGQGAQLLSGSARACYPRHQGSRRCKAARSASR